MASWFKCRACTARCTEQLSVGTIPFCPSCGLQSLERCEEFDERPTQSPLFFLPDVPRATRWKIEWRWTPAAIQNTQDLFNEILLPDAWFFHSEYSTERQAINAVARLRRNFGRRTKHYRSKPCLWNHFGDIELVLPPVKKATPTDYALIDELIAEGEASAAADAMTLEDFGQEYIVPVKMASPDPSTDPTFQSLYLEPHCGPDFCVKDGCPIHGTPDPWDEKQIVSP